MSQPVDLRIIGQIVSAIGLLHVFPSEEKVGEFLVPLLAGVPGCDSAGLCFQGATDPIGSAGGDQCAGCARSRERIVDTGGYSCGLGELDDVRAYPLETVNQLYGYLILFVTDGGAYRQYEPFVRNLGNALAMMVENRRQRDDLQRSRDLLELRVQERTSELHEIAERFHAIANYTVDWESWFGTDGRVLWMNPAVERVTGYSAAEVKAMPDFISTMIEAQDRDAFTANFHDALRGGKGEDFEFRCVHKNGSRSWLSISWQPIFDVKGRALGVRASGRDVTERKQAEDARARLVRELASKNQELQGVLYTVSHDLRSPLVNIQGFGRVLEELGHDLTTQMAGPDVPAALRERMMPIIDDEMPRALGHIRAGVGKVDALISGILRLFRLGHGVLRSDVLDMNQLVQQVVSAMAFQIEEAGATVDVERLPACLGDPDLIDQVFSNLLQNALKYRDPARSLRVRISGGLESGETVFCVADTGCGIAADQQARIWELFQRVDPNGVVGGEGLGLSLVRRIVDRHDGRAWVESTPGEGSRFFVALPGPGVRGSLDVT